MHNDLYPDMVIGCLKARTVPINVNYNYTPREVAELLEYLRPRAVIYHRSFGPKFADVLPPATADLMISVDDGSDVAELPGRSRWKMRWPKEIRITTSRRRPTMC